MQAQGFTHKWRKTADHPWTYLKFQKKDEAAQGRMILTFTDEGQAWRSYYDTDVVELA